MRMCHYTTITLLPFCPTQEMPLPGGNSHSCHPSSSRHGSIPLAPRRQQPCSLVESLSYPLSGPSPAQLRLSFWSNSFLHWYQNTVLFFLEALSILSSGLWPLQTTWLPGLLVPHWFQESHLIWGCGGFGFLWCTHQLVEAHPGMTLPEVEETLVQKLQCTCNTGHAWL